ncbi:hypothetical protein ACS0TY_034612 [Phlomoides rotata]
MLVESLGEFMKYSKEAMCDLNKNTDTVLASKNENKELNNIMRGISGLKVGDKLKVCDELV